MLFEAAEIQWSVEANSILGMTGLYYAYSPSRTNFCPTSSPELVSLEYNVSFVAYGNFFVKRGLSLNKPFVSYLKC